MIYSPSFASPHLLLALLAVPVAVWAYVLLERRRAQRAAAWSSPGLLSNMVKGNPGRRRYIPLAFFLLGLTLLLAGFARPQAKFDATKEGATVVLVMDTSGSMASNDVRPTRLGAADATLTSFVNKLPSKYRVALITFSTQATVKVPPTYDRNELVQGLPTKVGDTGTAIGDAVASALTVAKKAVGPGKKGAPHPPVTILLVSDGTQNAGKLTEPQAAQAARKAGINVSTISIGTASGKVTQPIQVKGKTFPEVVAVPASPTTLKALAKGTGGKFYEASSAKQLDQVYKDLGSRLVHDKQVREITVGVTAVALVLILVGALLSGLWFRRLV